MLKRQTRLLTRAAQIRGWVLIEPRP